VISQLDYRYAAEVLCLAGIKWRHGTCLHLWMPISFCRSPFTSHENESWE
jgi:hypothetical protein